MCRLHNDRVCDVVERVQCSDTQSISRSCGVSGRREVIYLVRMSHELVTAAEALLSPNHGLIESALPGSHLFSSDCPHPLRAGPPPPPAKAPTCPICYLRQVRK